jgi:hypothetical protein
MSQPQIATVTPEQEELIPVIRERWRSLALSTQPIDQQKATDAVTTAYAVMGKPEPEIRFLNSPFAAKSEILAADSPRQMAQEVGAPILIIFAMELENQMKKQLEAKLWQELEVKMQRKQLQESQGWVGLIWLLPSTSESEQQQLQQLRNELLLQFLAQQPGGNIIVPIWENLWQHLGEPLWQYLSNQSLLQWLYQQSQLQVWFEVANIAIPGMYSYLLRMCTDASTAAVLEFCINELHCEHDESRWNVLQSLVTECGLVFPFEKTCFICDRPIKLSLDSENRLHAEGEAAVEFADGNKLYFYQNVPLPEKYGTVSPEQWQAQWIPEEPSDKVRQVLEQVIRSHTSGQ